MKAPQSLIQQAVEDGSLDQVSLLLCAAYLLNSEASNLIEEAGDIMRQKGLMLGRIKQAQNHFTGSANRYFQMFAEIVKEDKKETAYFQDLEEFDRFFRQWAKLDEKMNQYKQDNHETDNN